MQNVQEYAERAVGRPMNKIKRIACLSMQCALDVETSFDEIHDKFEKEYLELSDQEQVECLNYFRALPLPERNYNGVINWYLYYKCYAFDQESESEAVREYKAMYFCPKCGADMHYGFCEVCPIPQEGDAR